jgi:hypothetical protein
MTREDFLICLRKIPDEELDVLRDCLFTVIGERAVLRRRNQRQAGDIIYRYGHIIPNVDHLPELTEAEKQTIAARGRLCAIRDYRTRTNAQLIEAIEVVDRYMDLI